MRIVRHGHIRLDRRAANRPDDGRNTLSRMRGIVLVHGLKIVRAEHEDQKRQRRIDFDALLDSCEAVASWLERIVPHGAAAVQAVLDHAYLMSRRDQAGLRE